MCLYNCRPRLARTQAFMSSLPRCHNECHSSDPHTRESTDRYYGNCYVQLLQKLLFHQPSLVFLTGVSHGHLWRGLLIPPVVSYTVCALILRRTNDTVHTREKAGVPRETERGGPCRRGGHRHLQIGRMLDIDLISEPPPRPLPPEVCIQSEGICVARGTGSNS